ncbi:hemoblobin-interacting domain-containing protein [Paenibacillus plantarum]|nr:DUF1533 domain-containing protein [Paenibacillus plantarum]
MGRLLSFLLVLAVVITPFSASFSGTAYANNPGPIPAPVLQSATVGGSNQDVVLTFASDVFDDADDWQSRIEFKSTYDGAFVGVDYYYGNYWGGATISGNTVTIHMNYNSLVGDKNRIRIKSGALQGQVSDIITGEFAAMNDTAPAVIKAAIGSDNKVTLTFNTPIPTVADNVYNYIQFRTNEEDDYSFLTESDTIDVVGNQMVITFPTPLIGYTSIKIASGAVQSADGINNNWICKQLDLNAITFDESRLSSGNDGNTPNSEVDLYFSQDVVSTLSDAELKAAITISNDNGVHFTALGDDDTVRVRRSGALHLHFFTSLTPGSSYVVKIASGALQNKVGLAAGELLSDTIVAEDPSIPTYQQVAVSQDGKTVTLTFDKNLNENDPGNSCSWNLYNYIYIKTSENSGYQTLNNSGGSVQISAENRTKLVITLDEALTGAKNKIAIAPGVLKDDIGHQIGGVVTRFIDVTETALPTYQGSSIDNLNHDWTLSFDKNVKINEGYTLDNLKANIKIYLNGVENSLDPSTTITFIENKVVLHFNQPLVDHYIYVYVPENAIADMFNNVLEGDITTDELTPNTLYPLTFNCANLITFHSVALGFSINNNAELADNTIVGSVSHLKNYVSYSTDKGITFQPLKPEDEVILSADESNVVVYFKQVIQGNLQIKIAENALKDTSGVILTTAVQTGDLNTTVYTPQLKGSFFSDAESILTFENNQTWVNKIQRIVLNEYAGNGAGVWSERTLKQGDDYEISEGKLKIHQGVFEEKSKYEISIISDGFDVSYSGGKKAIKSQDSYYMAPIEVVSSNGMVTASVNVAKNKSKGGKLNVIFQLMKGATPINIAAPGSNNLKGEGTYVASFSASDATATNHLYTVRAFIISEYSNSPSSVGANLAKQLTAGEFDLLGQNNNPR